MRIVGKVSAQVYVGSTPTIPFSSYVLVMKVDNFSEQKREPLGAGRLS